MPISEMNRCPECNTRSAHFHDQWLGCSLCTKSWICFKCAYRFLPSSKTDKIDQAAQIFYDDIVKCQSTNSLFWHYICSACVKIINADNDSNKDIDSSKGKEDNETTSSSSDSDNHPATDNNITNQKMTQNVEETQNAEKTVSVITPETQGTKGTIARAFSTQSRLENSAILESKKVINGNNSVPICHYYHQGKCLKGSECNFRHPPRCINYCCNERAGCSGGYRECQLMHPILCRNSLRNRECFDLACTLTHLKGTVRRQVTDMSKNERWNHQPQVPSMRPIFSQNQQVLGPRPQSRPISAKPLMVPPSLSEKNFPPLPCQQAVNAAQQPFLQPPLQQPGIMSHSNSFPGMSNYSPGNYAAPNEHTFSNANEPTAISSKPPIDTMSYKPFLQKPLNFPEFPSFVNVNSNTPSRHEKQRP